MARKPKSKPATQEYPKIPELNRAGYKAFFPNYQPNWVFEDKYPLTQEELSVVDSVKKQFGNAEIYAIRRVEKPDGTKMPDLIINGHKVEIKSVSTPSSAWHQTVKASKQGSDGIAFYMQSKNEDTINAINRYTKRLGINNYCVFKKDVLAADIAPTTRTSSTVNLPQSVNKVNGTELLVNNFGQIVNDESQDKIKRLIKTSGPLATTSSSKLGVAVHRSGGSDRIIAQAYFGLDDEITKPLGVRKRTNAYWEKRSNQRLVAIEQESLSYMKQIHSVYSDARRKLTEQVKQLYEKYYSDKGGFNNEALKQIAPIGDVKRFVADMKANGLSTYLPDNYRSRMTRLELLDAQMQGEIRKASIEHNQIETSAHRKTIDSAYYRSIYDIAKGMNYTPAFATLDERTIDKILNAKFKGKNYSERIWGNTDLLANKLKGILAQAVALGQPISKTSMDIRQAFNVNQYYADRLVRTETNYFNNVASVEAYESIGIGKFKFVATLDNRTSEICRYHDGKIYNVADAMPGDNVPPLHPNCRSTTVAYLGKEYEPDERIARNPSTGQNYKVANMDYGAWRKTFVNSNITPSSRVGLNQPLKSTVDEKPDILMTLEKDGIDPLPAGKLDGALSDEEIVEKIGGADKTRPGSCQSVALAYAANRIGLDVLDFRGGQSTLRFAYMDTIQRIGSLPGVVSFVEKHTSDFTAVSNLLKHMESGKEYLLSSARHAAIIRRTANGTQYLELQSDKNNGWHPLNYDSLKRRFKAKATHSSYGTKVTATSQIIDISSLKNSTYIKDILQYLNTKSNAQNKGNGGGIR